MSPFLFALFAITIGGPTSHQLSSTISVLQLWPPAAAQSGASSPDSPNPPSKLPGCDPLKPVRPLASLNRSQPSVIVRSVDAEGSPFSAVSVTVEVASTRSDTQKGRSGRPLESGAYDLHLFRDGQVVRLWPNVLDNKYDEEEAADPSAGVLTWRKRHVIELVSGRCVITFRHVLLPRRTDAKSVTFTAYAFNSDRVKSVTSPPYEYKLQSQKPSSFPTRRAYVIVMGVNANESHLNLEISVSSAERARMLVRANVEKTYPDVVQVSLYSDLAPDSTRIVTKNARKIHLKTVLDLLAGRSVDPGLRDAVDPKHQIRPAAPDDAVILYVASHGYVDPQGNFYLIPYDTGYAWGLSEDVLARCKVDRSQSATCVQARLFLQRSISSGDLANWWSGVDAGEVDMILDSCHSGAAPGKEFRPAPLGDPGLGQLSYDKAMRILVASQPAQTERGEWVEGGEGRTLLVEALEIAGRSNPQSSMSEWFRRTVRLLPSNIRKRYPVMREEDVQAPELLDFSQPRNSADSPTGGTF